MRLDPVTINATTRTANFEQHTINVGPSLKVSDRSYSESEDKGLRTTRIPVDAPQRIITEVARRLGTTVDEQVATLDYLVLSTDDDEEGVVSGRWITYFKGGRPEPAKLAGPDRRLGSLPLR